MEFYARVEVAPGVWVDMLKVVPEQGEEISPGVDDAPIESDWEHLITRRG